MDTSATRTRVVKCSSHHKNLVINVDWVFVCAMCGCSNKLTGGLPSEIGLMTDLTFVDVENNQLTGTIPATLGDVTSLQVAYFARNRLQGTIPQEIMCKVRKEGFYSVALRPMLVGSQPSIRV